MPSNATAVIELIGKDNGLSAIVVKNTNAISELTDAAIAGTSGMSQYSQATNELGVAFKGIGGSAIEATKSITSLGSSTTQAYNDIIRGSERTIKVADLLGDRFSEMALSAAGFSKQTDAVNSVLQPTAGFFSAVADEATGLGKAFQVINQLEKPLVGGLDRVSTTAGGLGEALSNLGSVGQFAAQGLFSVSNAAASLAGITKTVDTIGDLYQVMEQIQEVAPEVASGLGEFASASAGMGAGVLGVTDLNTELYLAAQAGKKFGNEMTKSLSSVFVKFTDLKFQATQIVTVLSAISNTFIDLSLHLKDFGRGLETVRNLGFDTQAAEIASSIGLIGENLVFNTEASKNFANAAVAAFSRVEDSLAFITTLPAGQAAGIPQLSKQLDELVNGPLNNMITKGEAASAMYQSLSAGIGAATGKLKESQPFMEAALKLSTGTDTAASTTVETLAKLTYAYNLNAKDATTTAAKLNGIVEEGIVTFPQLAGGIGRVAGVAAQAKVPMDELMGSIAALTKTMSADDAMTGYMSLLNAIAGAGEQSKKAASELGIQFDLQAIKAKGLLNVLKELWDKSGGSFEKIKEIIPDSLASGTALTLMTTAFKEAKEKTEIIGKKGSEDLEKLFGSRNQSMVRQMTSLVNGYEEVLSGFGEKFADKFKPGVEFLQVMLERFQNMPEPIKDVIGAIVSFNMALEKGSGAISILVAGITKIGVTLAIMRITSLAVTGQLGDLKVAAMGVVDAFRAKAGRAAALTTAINTLTGAEKIAAVTTAGLTTATTALGKVNEFLTADIGRSIRSWVILSKYIGVNTKAETASTIAKGALTVVTQGLSVALGVLGTTLKALWISFGPITIVLGSIYVAFQLLSEVINFNILGFKSAAAEAQEYAAKLIDLGETTKSYTDILDEENKAVEKSVRGYKERIKTLKDLLEAEKNPRGKKVIDKEVDEIRKKQSELREKEFQRNLAKGIIVATPLNEINKQAEQDDFYNKRSRKALEELIKKQKEGIEVDKEKVKAIEEQIKSLKKLEKIEQEKENKKYTGFMNTAVIPAMGAIQKINPFNWGRLDEIDEITRRAQEERQTYLDGYRKFQGETGVAFARSENERQVNEIFSRAIRRTETTKQGTAVTSEAREILESTKSRTMSAKELTKVIEAETKAYEKNKEEIEGKVTALQEALEIEKDPAQQEVIKNQIAQLNKASDARRKYTDELKRFINIREEIKTAQEGSKDPLERVNDLSQEQGKKADELREKMKSARNQDEKDFLAFQQQSIEATTELTAKLGQGMLKNGELGKKQLNSLVAAYKEFSDNPLKTEIGNAEDLNKMRSDANKFLEEIQNNIPNISTATAESLVKALLNQKVKVQGSDIAQSILSPEQTEEAVNVLQKIYEKSAQDQVDINNRKIAKINHQEALGIKRQTLAQKEVLEVEIKSNEEKLKSKQKYLDFLVSMGLIDKESDLYKKLSDEIVNLQYDTEQKKTKIIEAAINDRVALNKRGLDKEQAIAELGRAARLNDEQKTQDKLFELQQKQNLNQRKGIRDRIQELKKNGGDYNELEIELLKLMTEYENNVNDRNRQLDAREKERLNNQSTEENQILEKESNTLELQSKQLERQKKLVDSKNEAVKAESEITQSRLELQLRVTGDIQKQADIEYAIAKEKIKNLQLSQKVERENLVTQRQLQQIAIEREVIANKIAKAENQRAIATLKIDLLRAENEKRSVEEIKAMELQLSSMEEQARMLDDTGKGLEQNKKTQEEVVKNTEREVLARQKISMAGGVLDEQEAKLRKILAKYDKQIEQANLYTKQVELQNIRLTAQSEVMGEMYDLQNQVMDSQKSVLESRTNRMTGELQIAMNLIRSETKRRDLAQTIAQIKLRTLEKQQEIERKVLEIQILQNKAALEREKIQLRVQQSQNKADVIGAFANLQKVAADPKSSDAQKQAALLEYQAKQEQGVSLAFQGQLLGKKEQIQGFLDDNQRNNLRNSQSLARTQAEADVIGTLSPGQQRKKGRELRDRILFEELGITPYRGPVNSGNMAEEQNKQGWKNLKATNKRGGIDVMGEGDRKGYSEGQVSQLQDMAKLLGVSGYIPPSAVNKQSKQGMPQITSDLNFEEFRKNYLSKQQEFLVPPSIKMPSPDTSIQKGKKGDGDKGATTISEVKLIVEAINIDVSSNATPKEAAQEVKQAIWDELHDLTAKVKNKLK
jgi:TP901 family phage tail tape measure protein